MLARKSRIGKQGLAEVFRVGKPFRTSLLSIKYLPSPGVLQCAVVISKKVAKKAVERNRVRRAVYRALVPSVAQENKKHGKLVVFVQKIPADPLTPAFVADMESVWKKIN
ncbi:MAG: ribonuclease P protein component [bacterium]